MRRKCKEAPQVIEQCRGGGQRYKEYLPVTLLMKRSVKIRNNQQEL